MVKIEQKIVLLTGGSSGIGLALAKALAARNAVVVLAARDEQKLKRALESLPAVDNAAHRYYCVDVCDAAQVQAMAEWLVAHVGLPDILINAAGAAHPGYVQELDLSIFRWMMEVNYFGTVHVIKSLLPGMIQRGSGTIVNFGSLASEVGVFGYTAYSGSKFALRGFSDALRMELKPLGIRVSIVLPPDTDTPQLAYENQYKPPELKYLLPELGVISAEKVAQAVVRGIEREQYHILPDFGSRIIFWALRLTGNLQYPILDMLLARAQRQIRQSH
ncbi:MAG: SDR family oxidoreductase [Anaerolineales bacterium]|jgi:3-dehydrosphinganine reductase|nr:SDR family oxidoreductase [Anaerolineales bacterium]